MILGVGYFVLAALFWFGECEWQFFVVQLVEYLIVNRRVIGLSLVGGVIFSIVCGCLLA